MELILINKKEEQKMKKKNLYYRYAKVELSLIEKTGSFYLDIIDFIKCDIPYYFRKLINNK